MKTHTAPQRKQMTVPVYRFKALDDAQGIAEMIVSVFNCKDAANDRVLPGFFAKSIKVKYPKGVWMHEWTRPIAKTLEAEEWLPGDNRLPEEIRHLGGLYIKAQFNLEVQDGRDAFSHLKFGTVDEFSFGYDVTSERYNSKEGCNDLIEGIIYEWSPVLVGCNRRTALMSVKGQQPQVKAQYLGEYAEGSATFDAIRELNWSLMYGPLYSCLFPYYEEEQGMTMQEKITLLTGAFDEFRDLSLKIFEAIMSLDETAAKTAQAQLKALYPKNELPTPANGKFLTQIETVLAAVGDCTERAKGIQSLRVKDNRSLAKESADKVLALIKALQEQADVLQTLTESETKAADTDSETDRDRHLRHLQLKTAQLAHRMGAHSQS